jgi:hypothetical protein
LLETPLPVGEFTKVTVTGAQINDVVAKPFSF